MHFGVKGRGIRAVTRLCAIALAFDWIMVSEAVRARTMQQKLELACAGDIERLCSNAKPDPDKIKACLLVQRAQVSPDCIELVDASE